MRIGPKSPGSEGMTPYPNSEIHDDYPSTPGHVSHGDPISARMVHPIPFETLAPRRPHPAVPKGTL